MASDADRPFLRTILAEPAADGPRLVYADWLEDHGHTARAEFVRVQIERANLDSYDPRQGPLRAREQILSGDHGASWSGQAVRLAADHRPPAEEPPFEPLDPFTTRELPPNPRWYFRRGFPHMDLSPQRFLHHAADLAAETPLLQIHVGHESYPEMIARLRSATGAQERQHTLRDLFASPVLAQAAVSLSLFEPDDWGTFIRQGRDVRLIGLHLSGRPLTVLDLKALATFPGLARVAELSLEDAGLSNDAVPELVASPLLRGLRRLCLRRNRIGPAGVKALAEAAIPELVALDLSDNPIGDVGASLLADWPALAKVREFRLEGCDLDVSGVQALANSSRLTRLTQLGLQRNTLGGAGAAALLNGVFATRLARLDLCGNHIGSTGAYALATAAQLANLRRLYLSGDRDDLGERAVRWLETRFGSVLHLDWFEHPR